MEPKFVSLEQAKGIVPIGKSSIYDLVKLGRLTKYKIGSKTVFSIEELNALACPVKAATP